MGLGDGATGGAASFAEPTAPRAKLWLRPRVPFVGDQRDRGGRRLPLLAVAAGALFNCATWRSCIRARQTGAAADPI